MSAKHWKLGIIGWPLGYSLSPLMHNAALKAAGLEGEYKEYPVKPEDLEHWLETEAPKLDGFNVTMPHKEAAFNWLVELERSRKGEIDREDDRLTGTVNTVEVSEWKLGWFRKGSRFYFRGFNTDGDGFYSVLRDPAHLVEVEGKCVLLLGAGGSAQAIAMVLADVGVGRLMIWNRDPERARRLAEKVRSSYAECKAEAIPTLEAAPLGEADLLVNATPVGMSGTASLVDVTRMRSDAVVYDIVYNPPATPLLRDARARGMHVITGAEMLAQQGTDSFCLWTGVKHAKVLPAMKKALDEHFATHG